ncbi:hypothetical protein CC2G_001889 [Coprinopsis cinerea AmutBmut pab1-1]|nr:hypothetical protein CC2G_001889 [Coprinopsis cinerea AmutBmut pab1-1]
MSDPRPSNRDPRPVTFTPDGPGVLTGSSKRFRSLQQHRPELAGSRYAWEHQPDGGSNAPQIRAPVRPLCSEPPPASSWSTSNDPLSLFGTSRMILKALILTFLLILGALALPQDDQPQTDDPGCTFSCPTVDSAGNELVRSPLAISPSSDWYTIFDCVYAPPQQQVLAHTCHYDKSSGVQMMRSDEDNCPPVAVCRPKDSSSKPLYSGQDDSGEELKYEVPPWVDFGRYQLWLKEHHT